MALHLVIGIAIYSAVNVVLGQTNVDVIHFDVLDGKRCTSPLFSIIAQSEIACAARCAMVVSCKSQFFIPGTNRCIGCDSVYYASDLTSLMGETGAWYYRPYALYKQDCSNDKPCIENNNVCFAGLDTCVCDPFFAYDPSTAACTSDYTAFGETFQMYPERYVLLNDGFYHDLQTDPATCLSFCTNITDFTCYGVDHDYFNNICYYNNIRPSTVPTAWLESPTIFHSYVRNCA